MKRYQEGSFQQFWRRDHLITNNIPIASIDGLYSAEKLSFADAALKFASDFPSEANVSMDGQEFSNVHTYVQCPLDLAFQYCANIFSLEEWSFGIRTIQEYRGGLYSGSEKSADATEIYLRCEAYADCRTIDHLSAWDQGDELWMRSYFRLVDSKPSLNKPGTLIMHVASFHPYFSKKTPNLPMYIEASQQRAGREWIGDSWAAFCVRQKIDVHNLKRILETRFGNA